MAADRMGVPSGECGLHTLSLSLSVTHSHLVAMGEIYNSNIPLIVAGGAAPPSEKGATAFTSYLSKVHGFVRNVLRLQVG